MRSFLLLMACTGTKGDTASGTSTTHGVCGEPALEIGTGAATFETLTEDDGVVMVHGPQGGWHMLASGRANNTADIVTFHVTITTESGGVTVADNSYTVQLAREDDCLGYYPGMYAYLDVSALENGELDTPPELLSYEPMLISMTLTDTEGLELTDEIRVIATPDPVDVEGGTTASGG